MDVKIEQFSRRYFAHDIQLLNDDASVDSHHSIVKSSSSIMNGINDTSKKDTDSIDNVNGLRDRKRTHDDIKGNDMSNVQKKKMMKEVDKDDDDNDEESDDDNDDDDDDNEHIPITPELVAYGEAVHKLLPNKAGIVIIIIIIMIIIITIIIITIIITTIGNYINIRKYPALFTSIENFNSIGVDHHRHLRCLLLILISNIDKRMFKGISTTTITTTTTTNTNTIIITDIKVNSNQWVRCCNCDIGFWVSKTGIIEYYSYHHHHHHHMLR